MNHPNAAKAIAAFEAVLVLIAVVFAAGVVAGDRYKASLLPAFATLSHSRSL